MRQLVEKKRLFLVALIGLSVFLAAGMYFLQVDFSFESFYPKSDTEYAYYREYRKKFPSTVHYVFVAVPHKENETGIFDNRFLDRFEGLRDRLAAIEHVDTVITPLEIEVASASPFGMGVTRKKIFDRKKKDFESRAKRQLEKNPELAGFFVSKDQRYLSCIVVIDMEILDTPERDVTCRKIRKTIRNVSDDAVISGIPMIRTEYVEKLGSELVIFLALSVLFTSVILVLTYRNFWGTILPLIGVVGAIIWCMGFMGWVGKDIDLLTDLLAPILFVVGMADIIHFVTRYSQELQEGKDRKDAMISTLKEIGMAILLTSITTAIGFASLMISKVPPIRMFGMFAALGVLFAYIIAVILMPNALMAIPPKRLIGTKGISNSGRWKTVLSRVDEVVKRQGKWIVIGFVVVIGFSIWGMTRISFNAYLLDDVKRSDPLSKNMRFFEDQFYGFRTFEMAITTKNGHKITESGIVRDMDKIQAYLDTKSSFSPFLSLASVVKEANKAAHFGLETHKVVPDSQSEMNQLLGLIKMGEGEDLLKNVMAGDTLGRINARMPDVGSDSVARMEEDLAKFISAECDTSAFDYRITGLSTLTERNVSYLRSSLLSGLFVAFVLIGVIMGLLFKSIRMVVIAMIPNLIPMIFTAGVMGWAGIGMKASTSIVFVIAFGIAVDDTIHFLSRYRMELKLGATQDQAIRNTIMGTGKALSITTIILLAGFFILMASSFGGTFAIGLFTCLTLVMALLADMLLLPVLLRWFMKSEKG